MTEVLDVPLLATTFFTLFVIMDPPGTVPVFLALTSTSTVAERKRAALQTTAAALGVTTVFTVSARPGGRARRSVAGRARRPAPG